MESEASSKNIATEKMPAELSGRPHHDERAGGWIDDKVSGFGDGANQPGDQADRLKVRMRSPLDFFRPPARDCVVPPRPRADRRLLQDKQIIAAPARALAHAHTQ